jgi:hypothetical protein
MFSFSLFLIRSLQVLLWEVGTNDVGVRQVPSRFDLKKIHNTRVREPAEYLDFLTDVLRSACRTASIPNSMTNE